MVEACQAMKLASQNQDVQKDCDRRIRESSKTIGYFEDSLQELRGRQGPSNGSIPSSSSSNSLNNGSGRNTSNATSSRSERSLPTPPGQAGQPVRPGYISNDARGPSGRTSQDSGISMGSNRTPYGNNSGPPSVSSRAGIAPAPKVHYSNLGE